MTDRDYYAAALEQLRAADLEVDSIELGRSMRVSTKGDKGSKKSGWYLVHEITLKSGARGYVGCYQNWKLHNEPQKLAYDFKKLSKDERADLSKKASEAKAAAEQERTEKARTAGERARRMFPRLYASAQSDYLDRKRVKAHGVRFARGGTVVVPVVNAAGEMVGLQFIQADGSKKFLTGTPKLGAFHILGNVAGEDPLAIAEGYATAASVHEATGWPCVCAFDAGNLLPVARAMRAKYPGRLLLIAADDDRNAKGANKGKDAGTEAAAAVQAHLALPQFSTGDGTDFNDMHGVQGLTAVRECLQKALDQPPPAPPAADDQGDWDFSLEALKKHFVLIYGTTTVFDDRRRAVLDVGALRLASGRKTVDKWINGSNRRVVDQDKVVFDPTCSVDPATSVNLFRGFQMKPKAGKCNLQLQLLRYLCNESDECFDWVLKWLAYPLQHPGAKMQSALLLHGPEGAGKNRFFRAIREIYGEYGGIISQRELESQFNGWASAKLFVIGNEVVTRAELYHMKGQLKNMITEPEWEINIKHLPSRTEANHCNLAFFSNAIQPAGLDPDDRRYMILWTPRPQDAAFYASVAEEQNNGGIAALYERLLTIDLGDFNEHTKPILNEAKQDLIELGMDTHERFYRQWCASELVVPFKPCLTMDLYKAYRQWCMDHGERAIAREVVFSGAMRKRVLKAKKKYWWEAEQDEKQNQFFLPPDFKFDDQPTERVQLGNHVSFFRQQLAEWQSGKGGDKGDRSRD